MITDARKIQRGIGHGRSYGRRRRNVTRKGEETKQEKEKKRNEKRDRRELLTKGKETKRKKRKEEHRFASQRDEDRQWRDYSPEETEEAATVKRKKENKADTLDVARWWAEGG